MDKSFQKNQRMQMVLQHLGIIRYACLIIGIFLSSREISARQNSFAYAWMKNKFQSGIIIFPWKKELTRVVNYPCTSYVLFTILKAYKHVTCNFPLLIETRNLLSKKPKTFIFPFLKKTNTKSQKYLSERSLILFFPKKFSLEN